MHRIVLFLLGACTAITATAQKTPLYNAKTDLSYFVEGTDGYNGLSVAYHPEQRYYYCVFAGNGAYPLEVFDETGRQVYATTAGQDMRGLWYNPKTKSLGGTIFNFGGLFSIDVLEGGTPGIPNMTSFVFPGPDAQAVAVLDPVKQEVFCYRDGSIYPVALKSVKKKKPIALKGCPVAFDLLNPNAMIYTGYKNYEFGLLDYLNGKVYYFNRSGKYTHTTTLPREIPNAEMFRFAFCNDRIWLYNVDERIWYSYIAFQ